MFISAVASRFDRAAAAGVFGTGMSLPSARRSFWAALVLLMLIVCGIGGGVYLSARRVVLDAVHEYLESIARIKVDQVQRWLDGTQREADLAFNAPMFIAEVARWLAAGRPEGTRRALLLEHMQAAVAAARLRAAELRAADDGRMLLSTKPGAADDAAHRALARRAAAERRSLLEDFRVGGDGLPGVEMGFHKPLGAGLTAPPLVTAHVEIDVGVNLLPFLDQWPGKSPTAETLLFRVDTEEIVYLNRSRHDDMALPEMRRGIGEPTLLAAQVARGRSGAVSGTDYRGAEVIGYALPVDGTPWHLVAKVDKREALAELDRKAGLAALGLACLLGMFAVWKRSVLRAMVGRRHAAEQLRRSEARALDYARKLEDLYQNAPCGYHSIDAEGIVRGINDTELRWLGYAREEVVGRLRITDLFDEPSRQRFPAAFAQLRSEGQVADLELVYRRKDGTLLPVMLSATAIYDEQGRFVATRTTVVDISRLQGLRHERDRQASRIEELSHHLVAVQEEERRRLSCALQDRAAPNLAALKLTLDTLGQMLPEPHPAAFEDGLADAHALADDTVAGVREVCADLRPSLLDYAGLVCALSGYVQQYMRRTGIVVRLALPPDDPRCGAETEALLFRIVQEALANVARHARARRVDIALERGSEMTRLTVKDDGIGFDGSSARLAGPGIRSMRERAEFAGGHLWWLSQPGQGTEIHVEIATPQETGDSPWHRIAADDTGVADAEPQLICLPQQPTSPS